MNKKEIQKIINEQAVKLYGKELCEDCSDAIYKDLVKTLPEIIRIFIQEQHNLIKNHD